MKMIATMKAIVKVVMTTRNLDDEADFGENIDNCDAEEIDDSTSDDSIVLN
jgi:hypothetical protein